TRRPGLRTGRISKRPRPRRWKARPRPSRAPQLRFRRASSSEKPPASRLRVRRVALRLVRSAMDADAKTYKALTPLPTELGAVDRDLPRSHDLDRPRRQVLDRADVDRRQLAQLELVEAGPLLRERRPLGAVQGDLQNAEAEQRALQPDRRERDPDLLEQRFLRQLGDLLRLPALDHLHQHRGRGLADRAAPAGELHLVDGLAVLRKLDEYRHFVTAGR